MFFLLTVNFIFDVNVQGFLCYFSHLYIFMHLFQLSEKHYLIVIKKHYLI